MKQKKILVNNSKFLEFICEIATRITEEKFEENTFVLSNTNIISSDSDFVFSDEAQCFYNDTFCEFENLMNKSLNIYSI